MPIQLPIHIHDCDGCRYLGSMDREGTVGLDVYHCDGIDLIIRHGDDEQDNRAFPISMVRQMTNPEWREALVLYDSRTMPPLWRDLKHVVGNDPDYTDPR